MEDQIMEGNTSKHIRRRKKLLYITLLQQMEFYFSDSNLTKNRFFSQLIEANPYIDLTEFLNFNKIRNLTNNVDDLCNALRNSEKLRLSEDNKKVCRITEIQTKTNIDECTIYVERLPADADHDWLTNIFTVFGAVDYVSIPKYKHNKMIKGFAFVEFSIPESAIKSLEYFESIDCKLSTQMPPDQLLSITTFESDDSKQETNTNPIPVEVIEQIDSKTDIIKIESEKKETNGELVKRKCEDSEFEPVAKVQKIDVEENVNEIVDGEEVEEKQIEENSEKRKRKRKKSKKHQNDLKQIGLQVLSKKEWKQLRNKYLNLQKQRMKNLKEHLNRGRYTNYSEHSNRTLNSQKNEVETAPRFKYTPGTIINFQLSEVCNDVKKFKADLKTQPGIEYIDLEIGDDVGYLRFSNSESTLKFCNASPLNAELRILEDAEEEEYWQKITKEREFKLKKDTGKKQRGRDRLLRKAEKELGKHIRFENAE